MRRLQDNGWTGENECKEINLAIESFFFEYKKG